MSLKDLRKAACHTPTLQKCLRKLLSVLQILSQLVALGKSKATSLQSGSTRILRWNKLALTFGAINNQNYHGTTPTHKLGTPSHDCMHPPGYLFDVWRLRAEAFALSIEHASTIYKLPASGSQDLTYCAWVSKCTDQSL